VSCILHKKLEAPRRFGKAAKSGAAAFLRTFGTKVMRWSRSSGSGAAAGNRDTNPRVTLESHVRRGTIVFTFRDDLSAYVTYFLTNFFTPRLEKEVNLDCK